MSERTFNNITTASSSQYPITNQVTTSSCYRVTRSSLFLFFVLKNEIVRMIEQSFSIRKLVRAVA
jgi:hypothetical protein